MFNKRGTQSINCSVQSCKYHDEGGSCNLDSIQVSAARNMGSGTPEDESMCSSYNNL